MQARGLLPNQSQQLAARGVPRKKMTFGGDSLAVPLSTQHNLQITKLVQFQQSIAAYRESLKAHDSFYRKTIYISTGIICFIMFITALFLGIHLQLKSINPDPTIPPTEPGYEISLALLFGGIFSP